MSTIIQQPDSLSFSQNLRKFVISSSEIVSLKLNKGEEQILDEIYQPGANNQIEVDLHSIVDSVLSVSLPCTGLVTEQVAGVADFIATVDGTAIAFRVIKGGVSELQEMVTSFTNNHFLSWQVQDKKVLQHQPEWLTVYSNAPRNLKAKTYYLDNSEASILLASLATGKLLSVDVSWASINALAEKKIPIAWDVWFEDDDGTRLSYVQRYCLRNPDVGEKIFIWANTLGGIDTISLTGSDEDDKKLEHLIAEMGDDSLLQYQTSKNREVKQSTGYLTSEESRWIEDFFYSQRRYLLDNEGSVRQIVVAGSKIVSSNADDLFDYEFTYRFATESQLLNLDRSFDPLPVLEVPADFFLTELLSGLPVAPYSDSLLLAVQSPFAQAWQKLSMAQLWNSALPDLVDGSTISVINGKLQVHGVSGGIGAATWSELQNKPFKALSNYFSVDQQGILTLANSYALIHTHPYLSNADPQISNWNNAFGWGDHAKIGYAIAHTHPYRPDTWIPGWGEVTGKPVWTEKMGWNGTAVTVSNDLHITGKLIVDDTIMFYGLGTGGGSGAGASALWQLSDVADDVANSVYGDLIMYNGTHFSRINQSSLAPSVHGHTITQVSGLQGILDAKADIHAHPYLSDSDARIATWTAKQAALSGTGFVKSTAGTISYDDTNYIPLTGGALAQTSTLGVGRTFKLQAPLIVATNYARGFIGGNLSFDTVSGLWKNDAAIGTDITGILFANEGVIEIFANKSQSLQTTYTQAQLDALATMKISPSAFLVNGTGTFTGSTSALSFIKTGGLATEFLKANGTIDTNVYIPRLNPQFGGDLNTIITNGFSGLGLATNAPVGNNYASSIISISGGDTNHTTQLYLNALSKDIQIRGRVSNVFDTAWTKVFTEKNLNLITVPFTAASLNLGAPLLRSKLHIHDGAITLSDTDVVHGMTDYYYEGTFGVLGALSQTAGGLSISGVSDIDNTPMRITGTIGSEVPYSAAIILNGTKKSLATIQALAATESIYKVTNNGAVVHTVLGNGNFGIGKTPTTALDVNGTVATIDFICGAHRYNSEIGFTNIAGTNWQNIRAGVINGASAVFSGTVTASGIISPVMRSSSTITFTDIAGSTYQTVQTGNLNSWEFTAITGVFSSIVTALGGNSTQWNTAYNKTIPLTVTGLTSTGEVGIDRNLRVLGNLIVDGTIQFYGASTGGTGGGGATAFWQLSDVADDVANAVYGDLVMYNGTHFARINQSALAPAVHTHTITQVTGLQTALDGKSDLHTHPYRADNWTPGWGEVTSKPTTLSAFTNDLGNYGGFALAHTHPYLSDSDSRIANWNTGYAHSQSAHYTGADIFEWAKAATKPAYTKAEIGLGSTDNTADAAKSVAYAANAGLLLGRSDYSLTSHTHSYEPVNDSIFKLRDSLNVTDINTFINRQSGNYTVTHPGYSSLLTVFRNSGGSTSALEVWSEYTGVFRLRPTVDSNRYGSWATLWHDGNFTPSNYALTHTHPYLSDSDSRIANWNSGYTHSQSAHYSGADIFAWAKAATKPAYTKAEIGLGSADNTADAAKSVAYATYIKSVSHPNDFWLSNTWDGTYWQLTSNHASPVNVGHADNAGLLNGRSDYLPLTGGTISGSITATEIYNNGWFRTNNSGVGLFNQATSNHFYSTGGFWNIGYAGTQGIWLKNGHEGATLGALYAESNGNMGLLNSYGNWAVQVYNGATGGGYLHGSWGCSGNFTVQGTIQFYTASDRRLKTDLEAITNPIAKIKSLTGYFFNYTDQALTLGSYTSRRDVGLIAQDVELILPEATGKLWGTEFLGYKADKLIPLLVEAMKQQQVEIENLKQQLNGRL